MLFDTWLLSWDSESKVGDESQLHSSPFSLPSKDNEMPAGIWAEVLSSQAQRWPGSSSGGTGCVSEMLRAGSSQGCLLRRGTSGFPLAVADSMVSPGSHKASELLLCLILWWVVPTHREQPFFWCQVADEHLPVSSTRCWPELLGRTVHPAGGEAPALPTVPGKSSAYQCNWERAGQGWGAEPSCEEPDRSCGSLAMEKLLWMDLTHPRSSPT